MYLVSLKSDTFASISDLISYALILVRGSPLPNGKKKSCCKPSYRKLLLLTDAPKLKPDNLLLGDTRQVDLQDIM